MSKFTTAWANLAEENNLLRTLIVVLAALTALLGAASVRLALRAPILIERACFTKAIAGSSDVHTDEEIEAFLKEALGLRFDTGTGVNSDFLSLGEIKARETEQAELKRREMSQRVLVSRVTKIGDRYTVDTDRLLSVGAVRTVFLFPLDAKIESTTRTGANPYGLVLTEVKPKTEIGKEGKK